MMVVVSVGFFWRENVWSLNELLKDRVLGVSIIGSGRVLCVPDPNWTVFILFFLFLLSSGRNLAYRFLS